MVDPFQNAFSNRIAHYPTGKRREFPTLDFPSLFAKIAKIFVFYILQDSTLRRGLSSVWNIVENIKPKEISMNTEIQQETNRDIYRFGMGG